MAKFLVTGATGQIGSFLSEELVSDGEAVIVCDINPNPSNIASISSKVAIEAVDISDRDALLALVRGNRPDCIIHLAAIVLLESLQNPALAYRVNILGTNNVLESARLLDVGKVVFASSVVVYGNPKTMRDGIADENDLPMTPSDPYSTSKLASEMMGRFYQEKYGIDTTCMRITGAWGPGRYAGYTGQFNDYIRKLATGKEATFPLDFAYGKAKLRWMYVKDVARAFAHAARTKRPRSYLFNTGSKIPFNARDVVQALSSIVPNMNLGLTMTNKPTQISANVAGPNGLDVDCSKLYDELGFDSRFTLQAALKDMANRERKLAMLPPL